jgi:uncharacterized membrane protein
MQVLVCYSEVSHVLHSAPLPAPQVHAWTGYAALASLLVQAVVGLLKFIVKTREGSIVARWHGLSGPVVWLTGLAAVCTGLYVVVWPQSAAAVAAAWGLLAALALATLWRLFAARRTAASSRAASSGRLYAEAAGDGEEEDDLDAVGVGVDGLLLAGG